MELEILMTEIACGILFLSVLGYAIYDCFKDIVRRKKEKEEFTEWLKSFNDEEDFDKKEY